MTREECLERLEQFEGGLWWGESSGYGGSASVYELSPEGVRGPGNGTYSYDGPFRVTKAEHKAIKERLAKGDDDDSDDELVALVRGGGKPDTDYYRWTDGIGELEEQFFESLDDIKAEVAYIVLDPCETESWEELEDEELEEWCKVVEYMEKGFDSWYDLPGAERD